MIILLGVPGSGKSTQGELLVNRGKVRWLSTGEILRNRISDERRKQMLAGKLIDDKEMIEVLYKELQQVGDDPEVVLDGFPRTLDQVGWLLEQRKKGMLKISVVVHMFADESVVEKRLMLRGRHDDTPETMTNRFKIYQQTFQPIIKVFNDGGIPVVEINADQTVQAIHKDIVNELTKINIEV
jgi:adenylate kinase